MTLRVLVVEDEPDARKVLSLILKLDGFDVQTVAGGREAIEAMSEELPDLLLLDAGMPDTDGYAVCRWVRSNPFTAHLPVVMLSGKSDSASVDLGREAGVDEYLTKPIKPSTLTRHIRALMTRAETRMLIP